MEKVLKKEIRAISAPKEVNGRRYSGFNLLSDETAGVLRAIASGGLYSERVRQQKPPPENL